MQRNVTSGIAITVFALAATLALAQGTSQGGAQNRGGAQGQTRQAGQDRIGDRNRDQDRDRDRDYTGDQDRNRKRDQDRDRIYASSLMTDEERAQHWNQLRSLNSEQERVQYRLEHQKLMQQRAAERGVAAPRALSRSQIRQQEKDRQRERERIYGYELMGQDELEQHRERLRQAKTTQEREAIRTEHRAKMEARAREQGKTLAPSRGD